MAYDRLNLQRNDTWKAQHVEHIENAIEELVSSHNNISSVVNQLSSEKADKADVIAITAVNESTTDGGNNVVTFSDGSTLTVRNGTKGGDGVNGYSPIRGTDYWTDNDKAEIRAYVDKKIASSLPYAGESTGSASIIDILEFPAENINKNAFYRLLAAKFICNQELFDSWKIYCVDGLPEVGEPATTDFISVTAYYNIQDRIVYSYIDTTVATVAGVPVGWYTIESIAPAFDVVYGGVITDINDDPCDNTFRVLICYDYYIYQDGWCKVPFAYEREPEFDIQWNGDIGDRFALDMSAFGIDNTYFVKVSDNVFTTNQLIGSTYTESNGYSCNISENDIDSSTYPGAYAIGGIVVVHLSDELNSAVGLPTGYIQNGVYFVLVMDGDGVIIAYTNRLISQSKIVKIDGKYLDVDALGLHSIATSGNYYDLLNRPNVYTDVVRYSSNQGLSSTNKQYARNNIDVYSTSEVDAKIAEAIGAAIGGSY